MWCVRAEETLCLSVPFINDDKMAVFVFVNSNQQVPPYLAGVRGQKKDTASHIFHKRGKGSLFCFLSVRPFVSRGGENCVVFDQAIFDKFWSSTAPRCK